MEFVAQPLSKGVDAASVRNQSQGKSRVLISTDAISEFRVTSALYSAESGGSSGGQIEIVTKGGANELRGSLFKYFRNSALDARRPFDGGTVPEFHLNQFGGTVGDPSVVAGSTTESCWRGFAH